MPEYREDKTRDSQRSRVYRAEQSAFEGHADADRIEAVTAIQAYVDTILTSYWYEAYELSDKLEPWKTHKTKPHKIIVRDGRGRRRACGSRMHATTGLIRLPRWSRSNWVILHEMAHAIQTQKPGHGRQFANIYLDLVGQWMGENAHAALMKAYVDHGVKWTRLAKPHANRRWNG